MAAQTLSAKELAQQCGTDARTVRKFLRKHLPVDKQPGQGGRYNFTAAESKQLVKAFNQWAKGEKVATPTKAAAKAAPAKATATKKSKTSKKSAPEPEIKDEEVEEIDLSDLEGPGDDDESEDSDEESSEDEDTE